MGSCCLAQNLTFAEKVRNNVEEEGEKICPKSKDKASKELSKQLTDQP